MIQASLSDVNSAGHEPDRGARSVGVSFMQRMNCFMPFVDSPCNDCSILRTNMGILILPKEADEKQERLTCGHESITSDCWVPLLMIACKPLNSACHECGACKACRSIVANNILTLQARRLSRDDATVTGKKLVRGLRISLAAFAESSLCTLQASKVHGASWILDVQIDALENVNHSIFSGMCWHMLVLPCTFVMLAFEYRIIRHKLLFKMYM